MTFEPVSMTMPSVNCPTPFPQQPPRTFVLDRIKQRIGNYGAHHQKCSERYGVAQQIIRPNEKLETSRLWQRVQDNAKNKKGTKSRSMDMSRQKAPPIDPSDLSLVRAGPSLKRKIPMGGESLKGPGYGDGNSQQEPKKMKNDQQNTNNTQRQQEYPLPSVSVQIVQNFNGEPTNQIETTVNVHSNRNMPDSQSVRVNVDSKNIKQETDGRCGQPQQQPQPPQRQQQQEMHQQNMNQCPSGNSEPTDLGGLLGDFISGAEDLDMNMLHDIIDQMPEVMDGFDRNIMTPDTQRHMTSQSQQMPSQQMPSQSQQIPSQSQQMPSQSYQMTSQSHHHMMSQSHHPMTSQLPQMASQPPQMASPPHHHINSQSPQMTSQSHYPMTSQSPRVMPQSHQHMPSSQMPRTGAQQMHHHNMTSQSPHMTSQYPQQQHHTASQPQHMTSHPQHMTSHPQHMTSPLHHMASPPVQHVPQTARMVCKREKVDMYHGFRGNTPENKPEPQRLPRQNSHGMTQQNISANIVTRQSVQMSGTGNFSANLSAQQNISLNMMQQNNFPASHRVMQTNNNNMTSQHIHKLNQVAQFGSREPSPPEATRIYHPPANTHVPAQPGYYESHSQHLKQLAEKRSYGVNPGSAPMDMNPDPRSSQHYPSHYRANGPVLMSQQPVNMQSHHHHQTCVLPSGGQRVPHMDRSVYSRASQFAQAQRPGPGMNVMMQQSEAMMMKQYQMQANQHPAYYNRVPDLHPQQVVSSNPSPGYPPGTVPQSSWNAGQWPPSSHNPNHPDHRLYMTSDHRTQVTLEHMRPQMNSEIAPPSYLPELDSELNILDLDEILSKN